MMNLDTFAIPLCRSSALQPRRHATVLLGLLAMALLSAAAAWPANLGTAVSASAAVPPDEAACHICSLRSTHGEDPELEKIVGVSTYDGKDYYFCATDCKAEFDASPDWWVPLDLPFPVPDRRVTTLSGEVVPLLLRAAPGSGPQYTLIDFWATWCAPCKETMRQLQERFERGGDGVRIVGISIDEGNDALKKVRRYANKQGAEYPLYLDDQEPAVWTALKIRAVPTMLLVDAEGRVIWRYTGPEGEEQLDAVLESLRD